ncbi:MAG: cupredoxin domain-containing protein [Acidimicrobiales bacterium]
MPTSISRGTRRLRLGASIAALAALSVLFAACGSSSPSSSPSTTASPGSGSAPSGGSTTIVIKNFKFVPATLTVKVGTKITVHNEDNTTHTLTARNGAFDTGDISGGSTATFTVTKAGTFPYICNIHQYMTGTLTVTG